MHNHDHKLQQASGLSPALLVVDDLCFQREHRTIIPPLSLQVHPGELWHIQGPNGSGKTTFLKLLAGLLQPTEGHIIRHTSCAYLGTASPFPVTWTLREILDHIHQMIPQSSCPLEPLLIRFGVSAYWQDMTYGALSSGQQKRVALMMTWMHQHPIMFLDEPFTALDTTMIERLVQEIHDFCSAGGAILLSHHGTLSELPISHILSLSSMLEGA